MGRPATLRFLTEAEEEVDAALAWYLARSRAAAKAFFGELDHAVLMISRAPHRWPWFHGRYRRYLMPSFPFALIYQVFDHEVLVVALAHDRREPGYWKQRS